jgi:hypothetical protein
MLKNSLAAAVAALVIAVAAAGPMRAGAQVPAPAPQFTLPPYQTLAPVRVLGLIRRVFRSHRPPPPYETYTLVRTQFTDYGPEPGASPYPDPVGSYIKHYWVRNVDRAALTRQTFRDDAEGPAIFDRPALNEPRDPGPPTVDLFEPAPVHQHIDPQSFVPTPEPSGEPLKTIGSVIAIGESDYDVPQLTVEKNLLHLVLKPRRDPERNVLRQIWVDKKSYELRKVIAHDRLFTDDEGIFPMTITYTLGYLQNQLLVTRFHGVIETRVDPDGTQHIVSGIGSVIDIDFQDITFPSSLPAWYFDPRQYGQHLAELPI